jgi:hypothetical protein
MKKFSFAITRCLCLPLLALATGCAHMMDVSVQPAPIGPGETLPLRVALAPDKDFDSFKYEFHLMGDTWVYPFGPVLEAYARRVAETCFLSVEKQATAEAAFASSSVDLVLTPRAVKAESSRGVMAWDKTRITLVVEWRARDRATQNTVWLATITAEAEEPGGNAFSHSGHERVLMQKLFDELTVKTVEAIRGATELRGKRP